MAQKLEGNDIPQSEQQFRALIENGTEAIALLDAQGSVVYASPSASRALGYTAEELVGQSALSLVHPNDLRYGKEILQRLVSVPGILVSAELRCRHKDGSWRWLEGVGSNALSVPGVGALVINYRDQTDRRLAEDKLRNNERRLQRLIENGADQIAILTVDGILVYESPSARPILGYPDGKLPGHEMWELVHPDDLPRIKSEFNLLVDNADMVLRDQFRLRRSDGAWRWVEGVATNLLGEPSVYGIVLNYHDITERKQAEDRLRTSDEILQCMSTLVVVADAEGKVAYVNPAVSKLTGYPAEELLGDGWWQRTRDAASAREHQEQTRRAACGEMPVPAEPYCRMIHTRSGESRIIEWQDILGPDRTVIGVGQDITERKRAEEKLIQNERDLAEAQRVAHIGNWVMDADSGAVRWSDELYDLFEVEPGIGGDLYEHFTKRIHPDDLPLVKQNIEQARATGVPYQHEYRIVLGSGQLRTVASLGHAETDATGKVTRVFGTTQDITERKNAEQQLIRSERDLAEAQKVARIGNWSLDLETGVGHWSDEMYEIFGLDQAVPVNSYADFEKRLHPEDTNPVWQAHADAISSGEPFQVEHRIITSTGETRTIVEIGHPVIGTDGKVTGLFGTAQDITERKRAEASVRESEARYRALYEDSPVSLWEEDFSQVKPVLDKLRRDGVTDFRRYFSSHPEAVRACRDGVRVTDVNRATLQLFGAQGKSELLSAMSRFVDNEALQDFQEELINIAEGKRQFSWEGTNRTVDGRQLNVNLKWSVVPGYEETLSKVLVFIEDVTERRRAEQRSRLQLKRLLVLREIDSAITSSFDERFTLNLLVMRLASSLGIDAADVLLWNRYTNTLNFAAGCGFNGPMEPTEVPLSGNYAGEIIRDRRIVAEPDLEEPDRSFSRQSLTAREGFKSYYGVPLVAKGEVKGVLEVFQRSHLAVDAEWLDFLETFAGQAAIAIDNAQLFEGLQRSNFELGIAYDSTIEGWSRALDLRDKETEGHTQRVTELTVSLARRLGFGDEELLHVRRGALLHDIGKMGVPDSILLKPGPLNDEEWLMMRKHPTFAYELLAPIHYLKSAALEIPYSHHERWNGSGYPRGLKGEQIPLAARIFSVVDVWDALTSDRPYRAAWPKEQAVQYIQSQAGILFDPRVVENFMKLFPLDGERAPRPEP